MLRFHYAIVESSMGYKAVNVELTTDVGLSLWVLNITADLVQAGTKLSVNNFTQTGN